MEYSVRITFALVCCYLLGFTTAIQRMQTEEILFSHLFRSLEDGGYNKWIRPTENPNDRITVKFKLVVRQLLDVDEKRQLMSTNVWMKQSWQDKKLTWNPALYGNVTYFKVPTDYIWIPDIILMGNTDGNFTGSHMTRAVVHHNGLVSWEPPASFRSWCNIDVTYFPFDVQNCSMKFVSWTYDHNQVVLEPMDDEVDLSHFLNNGEWEIVDTHVENYHVKNLTTNYQQQIDVMMGKYGLRYCFIMRRLPLFYTVFLITPCLGISFLTGLVFYLPSDSQEKITLCISVLLAHTFYLLVITEIIPSTSNAIPLIGEYLLFTMIFITLSIIITTAVINVHYRNNTTHRSLPLRLRYVLLNAAPRILCLRPFSGRIQWNLPIIDLNSTLGHRTLNNFPHTPNMKGTGSPSHNAYLATALACVRFFVKRIKQKIRQRRETEEWMYAAMVMDRIFLALFMLISSVGTVVLFFPAWIDYTSHAIHKE